MALLAGASLAPMQAATAATPATVTGVISGSAGALSHVFVDWFVPATGAEGVGDYTDDTGAFSLDVPANISHYVIEANLSGGVTPGIASYAGTFVGANGATSLAWQLLTPYSTPSDASLDLRFIKNGTISGNAAAIKGKTIDLQTLGGDLVKSDRVAANGTYAFGHIVPGRYKVVYNAFEGGAYLPYTSSSIAVGAGATTHLSPRLVKGATVSGKVTLGGKPLKNIIVQVYSSNDAYTGDAASITDVKGHYSVTGLRPGKYSVSFAHLGSSKTGHVELARSTGALKAGAKKTINAALVKGGGVSGTFTAKKKSVVTLAVVSKKFKGYTLASGSSKTKLAIANLPAGKYTVYALQRGASKYASVSISVRAGKVAKLPKLTAKLKTLTLKGTVPGASGGVISAYDVTHGIYSMATVHKGAFTLKGLLPGAYNLQTYLNGYEPSASKKITLKKSTTKKFGRGAKLSTVTGAITFLGKKYSQGALDLIDVKRSADNAYYIDTATGSFRQQVTPASYSLVFASRYSGFQQNSSFYLSIPLKTVTVSRGKTKALGRLALTVRS